MFVRRFSFFSDEQEVAPVLIERWFSYLSKDTLSRLGSFKPPARGFSTL